MNALNKIGGSLLAAVLVLAVITGLRSGTAQEAGDGLLQAGRGTLFWAGTLIASVGGDAGVAGDLARALLIGLILFALLLLLVPKARAGRGFAASATASLVVALLLFQPSLGSSLRDAVSAPAPPGLSR